MELVFLHKRISYFLLAVMVSGFGLSQQANAAVPIEQGSLSRSNSTAAPNTPVQADSQGSTLWQLYQQVQQLQREVRELRGQLETQQDGLDRTQKDLKNRYNDLDQRLELLREQSSEESSENQDSDNSSETDSSDQAPSPSNSTPETSQPAISAPPPPPVSGANNKLYVQQATPQNTPPNNAAVTTDDADKQAYIGAYEAYKAGGAAKAVKPMQQFIVNYPHSVYVPNAHYWLGEFYLAINPADFNKAKKSFNEVVSRYPKSAKASTALYRLATIAQEIDKRPEEALALMKKLSRDYPNSAEAGYAKSFIKTYS